MDPFVAEIRIFPFNFALTNMQGNAPMHPGQGPGLSLHDLGETGGSDTVSLLESEIPSHSHALMSASGRQVQGQVTVPSPSTAISDASGANPYLNTTASLTSLNGNAVAPAGGDQPHNNLQPYLTLNFCIALQGVYPPRT